MITYRAETRAKSDGRKRSVLERKILREIFRPVKDTQSVMAKQRLSKNYVSETFFHMPSAGRESQVLEKYRWDDNVENGGGRGI